MNLRRIITLVFLTAAAPLAAQEAWENYINLWNLAYGTRNALVDDRIVITPVAVGLELQEIFNHTVWFKREYDDAAMVEKAKKDIAANSNKIEILLYVTLKGGLEISRFRIAENLEDYFILMDDSGTAVPCTSAELVPYEKSPSTNFYFSVKFDLPEDSRVYFSKTKNLIVVMKVLFSSPTEIGMESIEPHMFEDAPADIQAYLAAIGLRKAGEK